MTQPISRSVKVFIVIAGVLISVTTIIPTVYVLYLGLSDGTWNTLSLKHYIRILRDPLFGISSLNTLTFSLTYAVFQVILAFVVGKAVLKSSTFVRALFLVVLMGPWVISEMASVIMWRWIFFAEVGPLDQLSSWLGLGRPSIMIHTNGARLALMISALWRGFAFSTTFAIGVLASIPHILYHAASVEDLGRWRTIRAVELPVIRPAALTMGIVLSIQTISQFTLSARLTNGGPAHATTLISNYIYERLITDSHPGPSAAAGSMVFITVAFLLLLSTIIRRSIRQ